MFFDRLRLPEHVIVALPDGDAQIKVKHELKYLGVILDDKLNLAMHQKSKMKQAHWAAALLHAFDYKSEGHIKIADCKISRAPSLCG